MTEYPISPRSLDILRLITPEWTKLDNASMKETPEMEELYLNGLIDYKYGLGDYHVKLNRLATQFVPEYFN